MYLGVYKVDMSIGISIRGLVRYALFTVYYYVRVYKADADVRSCI